MLFLYISAPVNGWLADRFRAWRLLRVAPLVGAAGAIIAAYAPSLGLLYFGYGILHGIMFVFQI